MGPSFGFDRLCLNMVAGGKVSPKLPTQLNITDNTNYNTALAFA